MRFGLSYLAELKFKRKFQDCINHICSCGQTKTSHFFEKINFVDFNILQQNDLSVNRE